MNSALTKPSDFHQQVMESLKQQMKGITVQEYAPHAEPQISGIACHIAIDEYGTLTQHNDGRIKQPVRVSVRCFISHSYKDKHNRSPMLIAQDIASAVGRIVFNNHFGMQNRVSLPNNIISQVGPYKAGKNGYTCWETNWWQTLYLGELTKDEPKLLSLFMAVNPKQPKQKTEYKELVHAGDHPAVDSASTD